MTQDDFKDIIKPLSLLNITEREFINTVLVRNFNIWKSSQIDSDTQQKLNNEIVEVLNIAFHHTQSTPEYKDRINAIQQQLISHV